MRLYAVEQSINNHLAREERARREDAQIEETWDNLEAEIRDLLEVRRDHRFTEHEKLGTFAHQLRLIATLADEARERL